MRSIRTAEELVSIHSLGFRGEALSSIAAVTRTEVITKTEEGQSGIKYVIEGGKETALEETGAPNGTTFLIHQLFYNIPARRKFLKTPVTEAGHVQDRSFIRPTSASSRISRNIRRYMR